MQPPADSPHRGAVSARFFALIGFAALGALAFFPSDHRPAILRIALAGALVTAFLHLVVRLLEAVREESSGGFARALKVPPLPVRLDGSLTQLGEEVRYSQGSRRYFDKILWPRLRSLAERRGLGPEDIVPPEPAGLLGRRGVSLKFLTDLVDRLERPR
jgi:hypothetical protein